MTEPDTVTHDVTTTGVGLLMSISREQRKLDAILRTIALFEERANRQNKKASSEENERVKIELLGKENTPSEQEPNMEIPDRMTKSVIDCATKVINSASNMEQMRKRRIRSCLSQVYLWLSSYESLLQ